MALNLDLGKLFGPKGPGPWYADDDEKKRIKDKAEQDRLKREASRVTAINGGNGGVGQLVDTVSPTRNAPDLAGALGFRDYQSPEGPPRDLGSLAAKSASPDNNAAQLQQMFDEGKLSERDFRSGMSAINYGPSMGASSRARYEATQQAPPTTTVAPTPELKPGQNVSPLLGGTIEGQLAHREQLSPPQQQFVQQQRTMEAPELAEELAPEAQGPKSFWDKVGGGLKRVLSKPGVGDAMLQAGTRIMSEGWGGAGEGIREGVTALQAGQQDQKYTDTIEDLGKYLSAEERQIALAMPEGQGFAYLQEKMEGAEGDAARARGLVETLGMTPEAAAIMSKDAAASDRAMAGGRQIEMIKDDAGQSYLINTATGEQVGGPYGTEVPNLDREKLALAQAQLDRNLNRDQLNPLYAQVVKDYADTKQDTNALYALTEAVNLVNAEELDDRLGPWADARSKLGALAGDPTASVTSYLDNVLTQMGIQNLGQFKGAISDRELATALSQAGSITDIKDMLNAVIARNMRAKMRTARSHNSRIDYLKSEGIEAAGQLGFADEDLEFFSEMERRGSAASGRLDEILGEDRTYLGRESDLVSR